MRALRLRPALLLATALVAAPLALVPGKPAQAQFSIGVGIDINVAPPALPVYEPPPLPAPGYLWQPGYWAYGEYGYYWVPGTWIEPPNPGLLWTPGYWAFAGGNYRWNAGYWGPHVGFYGGINYGFGYTGDGYFGGEWRGGNFFYNQAVFHNFGGEHITNVFNRTVVVNRTTINNVSFNGGPRGIQARPTAQQESYMHEQHVQPTEAQMRQAREASQNRAFLASQNGGHPAIAATRKPGDFTGPDVVAARGATMRPTEAAHAGPPTPAMAHPAEAAHPNEPGHPGMMARPGEATRPEAAPHAGNTARPEARPESTMARPEARPQVIRPEAARPENTMARPAESARPAPQAERPAMAPHAAMAPHPAAPRPAPAPHPEAPRKEEPKH